MKIKNNEKYYKQTGSRILAILGQANNLEEANEIVDKNISKIHGLIFYRSDIGTTRKYKVNIDEGNLVVKKIQKYVENTFNEHVINNFGDFAGLYKIPSNYIEPILVSSTDGVGTKSILVLETYGKEIGYKMLGQDLVNHCVNDILVKGAKPLFFLDYFANSKIESNDVMYFVDGISQACQNVNCVLIGGETAEMADTYKHNKVDVAGMIVGIVEKNNIINGKIFISDSDSVLAFPSSGPQTNGYTLIRKIVEKMNPNRNILDQLCATHTNFYHQIMKIINMNIKINGLCHITGGGLIENPIRVLPNHLTIQYNKWNFSPIFKWIQENGNISHAEMLKVFNCGLGMLLFINQNDKNILLQEFPELIDVGFVIKKL